MYYSRCTEVMGVTKVKNKRSYSMMYLGSGRILRLEGLDRLGSRPRERNYPAVNLDGDLCSALRCTAANFHPPTANFNTTIFSEQTLDCSIFMINAKLLASQL